MTTNDLPDPKYLPKWLSPEGALAKTERRLIAREAQIDELTNQVIELACDIPNQPNLWRAMTNPESRQVLINYCEDIPDYTNIRNLVKYIQSTTRNYKRVCDLLIDVILLNDVLIIDNVIKSIGQKPLEEFIQKSEDSRNQEIKANLVQLRNTLAVTFKNPEQKDYFCPELARLIDELQLYKIDSIRIDQLDKEISSVQSLRDLSLVIGAIFTLVSQLTLATQRSDLVAAEGVIGVIGGSIAIVLQVEYLSLVRRLTKLPS